MPEPAPCARCGHPHLTRHGHQACAGHLKNGPRTGLGCTNPPLTGLTVCRTHGGGTKRALDKSGRAKAAQAAAKELARLGQTIEIGPAEALLDLVHWTAGEVVFWRQRVQAIADGDEAALTWGKTSEVKKTSGQWPGTDTTSAAHPNVAYAMLTNASDRLANYAAAALKAGVEERRVRLAEQTGDLVATVIRRILDALALTPAQLELVPQVVPRELRAITQGAPA